MSNIDFSNNSELKDCRIIATRKELQNFLSSLRQDWFSSEKLQELNLEEDFENWIKSKKQNVETFFAYQDERDDHAKNDGWGSFYLFRCLVFKTANGEVFVLKKLVKEFPH